MYRNKSDRFEIFFWIYSSDTIGFYLLLERMMLAYSTNICITSES